jgi:hypothetical protein
VIARPVGATTPASAISEYELEQHRTCLPDCQPKAEPGRTDDGGWSLLRQMGPVAGEQRAAASTRRRRGEQGLVAAAGRREGAGGAGFRTGEGRCDGEISERSFQHQLEYGCEEDAATTNLPSQFTRPKPV